MLFRRCRDLVSRSVGSIVTPGQALETVCDEYLDRHDPERKAERLKAKDEATASLKGGDPEPSWVDGKRVAPSALAKRTLLRRAGDRCWVKGCGERVFLQRAYIHPVRAGGSNDPANQFQGCWEHHWFRANDDVVGAVNPPDVARDPAAGNASGPEPSPAADDGSEPVTLPAAGPQGELVTVIALATVS